MFDLKLGYLDGTPACRGFLWPRQAHEKFPHKPTYVLARSGSTCGAGFSLAVCLQNLILCRALCGICIPKSDFMMRSKVLPPGPPCRREDRRMIPSSGRAFFGPAHGGRMRFCSSLYLFHSFSRRSCLQQSPCCAYSWLLLYDPFDLGLIQHYSHSPSSYMTPHGRHSLTATHRRFQ